MSPEPALPSPSSRDSETGKDSAGIESTGGPHGQGKTAALAAQLGAGIVMPLPGMGLPLPRRSSQTQNTHPVSAASSGSTNLEETSGSSDMQHAALARPTIKRALRKKPSQRKMMTTTVLAEEVVSMPIPAVTVAASLNPPPMVIEKSAAEELLPPGQNEVEAPTGNGDRGDSTTETAVQELLQLGVQQKHIDGCKGSATEIAKLLALAKKKKPKKKSKEALGASETSISKSQQELVDELQELGVKPARIEKCGGEVQSLEKLVRKAREKVAKKRVTEPESPAGTVESLSAAIRDLGVKDTHITKCNGNVEDLESLLAMARRKVSKKKTASVERMDIADGADSTALWSEEEYRMLKAALKKHPVSIEAKERFTLIAEDVPERTAKECYEKFKALKRERERAREGAE
jgi:hypothetical protein